MYSLLLLMTLPAQTPQEAIEIARAKQHIHAARQRLDTSTYQETEPTYGDLYKQAVAENRPLIVLVKVNKPYTSPAYLYYITDRFDTYSVPTVIVSKPQNGVLYKIATFPYYSDREIDDALAKPIAQATGTPGWHQVCTPAGCFWVPN